MKWKYRVVLGVYGWPQCFRWDFVDSAEAEDVSCSHLEEAEKKLIVVIPPPKPRIFDENK